MKTTYLKFLIFVLSFIAVKQVSAQSIISVVNDSAFQGQTLNVVITGAGTSFGQGTSTTQVWLSQGGTQLMANSVTVTSPTELTANITIPAIAPTGLYDVNTYESIDNTLTSNNAFIVMSSYISIIDVSPNNSVQGQTLDVMITGNNTSFGQGTSTTQVWLSQGSTVIFANSVTVNTTTEAIANITLPANAPAGYYDVNTFESVDQQLTLSGSFLVMSSTSSIVSVQADSAVQGQTLNVVITGNNTGFGQGTNTTQIWLSQGSSVITPNSITITSPTEAIANFTFPTFGPIGLYNVNTYDPIDNQLVLNNGFNLIPLDTSISGIGTQSGLQGQTINLVINGYSTSFGLGRAAPQVWLSHGSTIINANSVIVNNTSEVVANFTLPANAPLGLYDVNVLSSVDGLLVLTNGFILQSITTGIIETHSISLDKVYPNPFTDELKIQYTLNRASEIKITMYDISGRIISNNSTSKSAGDHTYDFDSGIINIPAGVYFIRLTTNEKDYNHKVIKQ